jgi:integrase
LFESERLSLAERVGFGPLLDVGNKELTGDPLPHDPIDTHRLVPHIYTEAEIAALLDAAAQLRPVTGLRLRPRTYVTLFGLLASTGLRISEALVLSPTDVDLPGAVLTVRQTKFRKSRLVPLHPTTVRALTQYVEARRQCVSDRDIGTFLIADRATPLGERMAQHTFAILRGRLGWIGRGGYAFPRIHDLRHTYVSRTLVRAYQQQQRVDHVIDVLSTLCRPRERLRHVLVCDGDPRAPRVGGPALCGACRTR